MPTPPLTCPACGALVPVNGPPARQVVCRDCGRVLPAPAAPADAPWYYARDGRKCGPFSPAELRRLVSEGWVGPGDMVLPPGSGRWAPAGLVPGLCPAPPVQYSAARTAAPSAAIPAPAGDSGTPRVPGESINAVFTGPGGGAAAPPPPGAVVFAYPAQAGVRHVLEAAAHTRPPWNPTAVAWLGLLFTPLWSGAMAALNARQLRLPLPRWRALAIAGGWLVAEVLVNGLLLNSFLVSLLLYLLAVGLIASLDLRPQRPAYEAVSRPGRPHPRWALPVLAGSPLAVLTVLGFVAYPLYSLLRPLTPREVSQRFARASEVNDLAGMRRYSTMNLWAAVAVAAKRPGGRAAGTTSLPARCLCPGTPTAIS